MSDIMDFEDGEIQEMRGEDRGEGSNCQMCNLHPRLYKCPRCSVFTCSLSCCKEHKTKMECSGVRDKVAFVAKRSFNESNLRNDFHFLEDILETKNRAKRALLSASDVTSKRAKHSQKNRSNRVDTGGATILSPQQQFLGNYSKGVKNFVEAAKMRDTTVVLMPNGMTKRTLNKSFYSHKEKVLYWSMCVVFITDNRYEPNDLFRLDLESTKPTSQFSLQHPCLVSVALEKVNENRHMADLLESFLKPTPENAPHRYALRSLRQSISDVRCLLHQMSSSTSDPVFSEVSMQSSIKEVLSGRRIIEYPTVYFGTQSCTSKLRTMIAATATDATDATGGGAGTFTGMNGGEPGELVPADRLHGSSSSSSNGCSAMHIETNEQILKEEEIGPSSAKSTGDKAKLQHDLNQMALDSPQQQQASMERNHEGNLVGSRKQTICSGNSSSSDRGDSGGRRLDKSTALLGLNPEAEPTPILFDGKEASVSSTGSSNRDNGTVKEGEEATLVPVEDTGGSVESSRLHSMIRNIVPMKHADVGMTRKLTSSNVAKIVDDMKQLIDHTMAEEAKEGAGDFDDDDSDEESGDAAMMIGNEDEAKDASGSNDAIAAGISSAVHSLRDKQDANNEFLDALQDFATTDIASLQAIIAEAEIEAAEDGDI